MNKLIKELLITSPELWDRIILYGEGMGEKKPTEEEICLAQKEADRWMTAYATISGYLSMRGGNGTSDHTHAKAMKYAEKLTSRVRKALGYASNT